MSEILTEEPKTTTISPEVYQFVNDTNFKLDWTRRRKVIFLTLMGCGALFSICLFVLLGKLLFSSVPSDDNLLSTISTAMMFMMMVFVSLASGYIFGVQMDINSLRKDLVGLVNASKK